MKKFSIKADVYISKKRHVHIAFRKPISDLDCFDRIPEFISEEWKKRKFFFEEHELIYTRLITSLKWRFDHVFFKKEKVKNGSCLRQTL